MSTLIGLIKILFVLQILKLEISNGVLIPSPVCPNSPACVCDITGSSLLITCSEAVINPLVLPNPSLLTPYSTLPVQRITITNSHLTTIPSNLCAYTSLVSLDLSTNLINVPITNSFFSCLRTLQYLFLSRNYITSISDDAFNSNTNLITLDLSNNSIARMPIVKTFYTSLTNLQIILLNNNTLTNFEPWFFFLTSIKTVNLRFNKISTYSNQIGLDLNSQTIKSDIAIDVRNNQLTYFDDSVLRLYGVCTLNLARFFIQLLYSLQLGSNPINCNCVNSYNLLTYVSQLTANLTRTTNIFANTCQFPLAYLNRQILTFDTPATSASCAGGALFTSSSCSTTSIPTTTVQIGGSGNLINAPELQVSEQPLPELYSAQIAGIVLGVVGFFILFLVLLYCICPIEILSVIFGCIPAFYSFCPCKSGVKRDKEFDLFISYNRCNESWVKNKLVPFINDNYLVKNYILHYNSENQQVFNRYIKKNMSLSSCILFVLSDKFLIKEWNNKEFRSHLRRLITKEKTRFICVQMHDVCDEEVDEYFNDKLQIPRFVSLEDDEFLFWSKLSYFLFTNDSEDRIMPVQKYSPRYDYDARPNDDLDFDPHNINRPIIHLHGHRDPYAVNQPQTTPQIKHTTKTKRQSSKRASKKLSKSVRAIEIDESFNSLTRLTKTGDAYSSRPDSNLSGYRYSNDGNIVLQQITKSIEPTGRPIRILAENETTNDIDDYHYLIKKNNGNIEVTMPPTGEVYTTHRVYNKTVSTTSLQDDSNESSI